MIAVISVAIGGALGSVCRYGLAHWATLMFGRAFPYGIFAANVVGSFLIGLLMMLIVHKWQLTDPWRLLILVGFLGGFTTFSSFSLDAVQMLMDQLWLKSILYMLGSLFLSVAACGLGVWIATKMGA